MYVGETNDGDGLAHLVWELVSNAVDEHLAGRCSRVAVEIEDDGTFAVLDDGRGIPVEEIDGVPFAERALTMFHDTATMDGHAPHEHIGLFGVGLVAVNALSTWLIVDSYREGIHYTQRFERGRPASKLASVGKTSRSGTRIRFLPDADIFDHPPLDPGRLFARLQELSFLLPGLRLEFRDLRPHAFIQPRGMAAYVETRAGQHLFETLPFVINTGVDDIWLEAAATWTDRPWTTVDSFANVHRTTNGGTHVRGLFLGLVGAVKNNLAQAVGPRTMPQLEEALSRGLIAAVCVRLNDPEYGSPTKDRLSNPRVRPLIRSAVEEAFGQRLVADETLRTHLERLLTR